MKPTSLLACTALLACFAWSGSSFAADPTTDIAESAPESKPQVDRFCPDATATRIKRPHTRCSAPGRVYSREDLERTGATTAGGALSKLDPSIRGGGF
jgi:outer membrane cobalamin receptor